MTKVSMLYAAILLVCLLNVAAKGENHPRYETQTAKQSMVNSTLTPQVVGNHANR